MNYVTKNTVPVTVVPFTFIRALVIFSGRIRRWSVELRSLSKPLSLASLMSSRFFYQSHIYSLSARRLSELEKDPTPNMCRISSTLARCKLRYFLFADITGFRRPNPDFLAGIILRDPSMGEMGFFFPDKIQGKKASLNHLLRSWKYAPRICCDAL